MTTIEELERELEQFHKNIAGSNKLIETINAVIEAVKSQREDFAVRSETVTKLIESLPETVEEKNAIAITNFYRQILEVISKEHKYYIDNIDKYVTSLDEMKNGLTNQQTVFLNKFDEATNSFSQACVAYQKALVAVKAELAQETAGTMNAITAENAKTCENYLQQIKIICAETKEGFALYVTKLEQLTSQFAENEKGVREIISNAEKNIGDIVSEHAKNCRETSDSISQSAEHLLLEIKVYIEHLERQNETLVKNIEEKFNNSFKVIQNENAQIIDKLNQVQSSQKKTMLLAGIGLAVVAILCVLGLIL